MKIIASRDLDALVRRAQQSPRKRAHLLLHTHSDPVLKLVMAMEPGTYAQPNRHPGKDCQELYVVLRGKLRMIFFDDDGRITESTIISSDGENIMVEVPPMVWHTLYPLEKGSVTMEVIKGPYSQTTFKEFAPWAPSENDPFCEEYTKTIRRL